MAPWGWIFGVLGALGVSAAIGAALGRWRERQRAAGRAEGEGAAVVRHQQATKVVKAKLEQVHQDATADRDVAVKKIEAERDELLAKPLTLEDAQRFLDATGKDKTGGGS